MPIFYKDKETSQDLDFCLKPGFIEQRKSQLSYFSFCKARFYDSVVRGVAKGGGGCREKEKRGRKKREGKKEGGEERKEKKEKKEKEKRRKKSERETKETGDERKEREVEVGA